MGRITDTVKVLLIINILFFVGTMAIGDRAFELFALWFPKNDHFHFWQLVTHMFMHAGFAHILFNMFALYVFGSLLEQSLGQNRFLFLYFSAGLGAAGLQILFSYYNFDHAYQTFLDAGVNPGDIDHMIREAASGSYHRYINVPEDTARQLMNAYYTPMVGASGAIFGVMTAFAIIYPNLPLYLMFIPVPIKAKYLIGGYFLITLFSAVTGTSFMGPSNTAYWAHIGGAVIGAITMWYWKKNQFNQNRWD